MRKCAIVIHELRIACGNQLFPPKNDGLREQSRVLQAATAQDLPVASYSKNDVLGLFITKSERNVEFRI